MGKKLDRLYIRVDAQFTRDEKYQALPDRVRDSAYLFFEALNGWSRDKKTDGRVPVVTATAIGREMKHTPNRIAAFIEALVGVGLLVHDGAELAIPKYAKWQDTREEIEERSDVRREAGRRGGLASGRSRREAIASQQRAEFRSKDEAVASEVLEANAKQTEAETETETETENPPLPPRKRRGAEPTEYQAFVAELNQATGRRFQGDDESRRKYAQVRHSGRSADDLLAAARGVVKSSHHMGQNDAGVPYNAPINVLRSKVLDQLIGLGKGEIEPGRTANGAGDDDWKTHSWALHPERAPGASKQ